MQPLPGPINVLFCEVVHLSVIRTCNTISKQVLGSLKFRSWNSSHQSFSEPDLLCGYVKLLMLPTIVLCKGFFCNDQILQPPVGDTVKST